MNEVLERMLAAGPGVSVRRAHDAFDEFLNLTPEARRRAVAMLQPEMDAHRLKARRTDDQIAWELVLGCILANALAAGQSRSVFYSRAHSTYQGRTPYKPDWLNSKTLIKTMDRLGELGLVVLLTAPKQPEGGLSSSFLMTPRLMGRLALEGVTATDAVPDDEAAPVLFLTDQAKRLVAYDINDAAILAMDRDLRAYNAFISEQALTITPGTARFEVLAATPTRMFRVFNDGSWDLGGRFYGAFWEGMPAADRARIRINGETTGELDFSAFNFRALYHLAGSDFDGDPYAVPALRERFEQAGWDWPTQGRPLVKSACLRMINGAKLRYAGLTWPWSIRPSFAEAAVRDFHSGIASSFSKRCGLELMRLDSRIAEHVLQAAQARGVPVLPIHDGFRTLASQIDWLRGVMIDSYRHWVGFDPVIS